MCELQTHPSNHPGKILSKASTGEPEPGQTPGLEGTLPWFPSHTASQGVTAEDEALSSDGPCLSAGVHRLLRFGVGQCLWTSQRPAKRPNMVLEANVYQEANSRSQCVGFSLGPTLHLDKLQVGAVLQSRQVSSRAVTPGPLLPLLL